MSGLPLEIRLKMYSLKAVVFVMCPPNLSKAYREGLGFFSVQFLEILKDNPNIDDIPVSETRQPKICTQIFPLKRKML